MSVEHSVGLECSCFKGTSVTCSGGGELLAEMVVESNLISTVIAEGEFLADFVRLRSTEATLEFLSSLEGRITASLPFEIGLIGEGEVDGGWTVNYALSQDLASNSVISSPNTDKIAGKFGDFICQEKLFPSADLPIDSGFIRFVGPNVETSGLFSFIDEGVYQGVMRDGGDSFTISDDENTFIHPGTVNTPGLFQYKCELTNLHVRPDHSAFRIRAAAPLDTYEARIPPLYTVFNIRLSDPSGNLVVKYHDIQMRGDSSLQVPRYATYSSLPEFNAVKQYDWQRRHAPHMHEVSGYQLSFNVRAVALDDPFDIGFDVGFEENYSLPEIYQVSGNNYLSIDGSPLASGEYIFIDPTPGFRVSAVEICNSGGFGPRREDYFPFYMEVPETGNRLERFLRPTFMPTYDYDTSIASEVFTTWEDAAGTIGGSPYNVTNEDKCGAKKLVDILNKKDTRRYIKVRDISGKTVDGKLILRFGGCESNVDEVTLGAFNFEFDQSAKPIWWTPTGSFNTESRRSNLHLDDSAFYRVDTLTLKVLAKKASGTPNYILDVVGYSDDKLLNRTSPVGGFIQSPESVTLNDTVIPNQGQHPVISGFYGDNSDWTLSGGGLSERDDYFEASGNDHYKLAGYPVVDSLDFRWYEIPLQIVDDQVRLGLSRDYSISSLMEKVYLDIYPLPSGAAVAYAELAVRYAPTNAIGMYTQGGEKFGKAQDGRSEGSIFPSSMSAGDDILNAGSGYGPISRIEGLPHLYSSPSTIKSNYSRRWRGVEGTVNGPYDPNSFSFAFENPVIDYPFLNGYFKFDDIRSNSVVSSRPTVFGSNIVGSTDPGEQLEIYQNIGWRVSSGTLFNAQLPGFSGSYTTSDWTSLSSGSVNFVGNPLYGKISDAFDRVARVSPKLPLNFGGVDTSGGFSIFVRFTPDATVSGASYSYFNSGIVVSKSKGVQYDFAIGYSGGYLCAHSTDNDNNPVFISDPMPFDQYQYPLNVLLTYNDRNQSGLKLYTDNEFAGSGFNVLRASSAPFRKIDLGSGVDLILGHSVMNDAGMPMLVSEFGLSTYSFGEDSIFGSGTNIVESNPNKKYKQVTAEKFLENSRVKFFDPSESHTNDRYKLWDRVNDDTYNNWQIGDFKYCQFNTAFSILQKRPNKEQIIFEINLDQAKPYSEIFDSTFPAIISSGVAYHTQVENDFLRFHLSNVQDSFYSVDRRITKSIPCGYKFSEKAIVVETVVEYDSSGKGNLSWESCDAASTSGAKLIVSLYTKKQDPYWTPEQPNWGLINRKVHYINPKDCLVKLESTFSYDDLCDSHEQWYAFPDEPRVKDFSERLFSEDINDMFLQYDLAYPSGGQLTSLIRMHSAHVRMSDVNIFAKNNDRQLSIFTSGAFPANSNITLNVGGFPRSENDGLPLTINVPLPYDVFDSTPSGFFLNVSGTFRSEDFLPLYIPPQSGYEYFNLSISGEMPSDASGILNLAMPETLAYLDSSDDGKPSTSLAGVGSFFGMPLTLFNSQFANTPDGPVLTLNTFGSLDGTGVRDFASLVAWNNLRSTDPVISSGGLTINLRAGSAGIQRRIFGTMPLYINAPNILLEDMPLYIHSPEPINPNSGLMSLVTANYSANFGSAFGLWFNNNYGQGIETFDNFLAAIPADNEIRGVDLMAYGSCTGDSPSKAIDRPLVTDCTVWREEFCNDAGIFRAKDTYTNPDAVNFSGGVGYSGEYYGIRKYTQLIPSVAYNATMTIKTGSTESIPVPRTFEEWEYGMCGPAFGSDGCCTEDCDQNLAFSGVKFIGDASNLPVNPDILSASGRKAFGEYGSHVIVRGDLMAVSAPKLDIPDYDQYRLNPSGQVDPGTVDVSGAGAIFLYRRQPDVAGKKAAWTYSKQLMLPTGYRKDYIQRVQENLLTFGDLSISGSKWQIGQEGREFGTSVGIASSGNREVVVVGAPRAKWFRQFQDIPVSGVPSACVVFADLFNYDKGELASVASEAGKFNTLWKYFSAPWNPGPNQWYPEIKPKVLVLQLAYSDSPKPPVPRDEESWFVHRYIPRLDDLELLEDVGSALLGGSGTLLERIIAARPVVFNTMYSGILDAFFTAFPRGIEAVYSGIPAIIGSFREQTGSTVGALKYADPSGNIFDIYEAFSNFYSDYSYASGVYDQTTNTAQNGHLNIVQGRSENWVDASKQLLSNTFDSGRLAATFTNLTLNRNFITSGVGQEWGDTHGGVVQQFQVPPASGGRVYIFENERGSFNCIQVIVSPNDQGELSLNTENYFGSVYGRSYNDRFGHAVSISQNGEILTIGSPFNYNSCKILGRDESVNQTVYSHAFGWSQFSGKSDAINHYNVIVSQSGIEVARISTYDFLSESDRFAFRNDLVFWSGSIPQPYKLEHEYGYGNINYIGTRQFLPAVFAPTSRLGWSTAVNEDGDIAAFGAPTDSFNEFDDCNVWGDDENSWASYHNAGAVRVFESRKYYPHNNVVEFGLFGNLDRSFHRQEREAGFYDTMGLVFEPDNRSWRRTDFSEIEIPQDAGLSFIITPEIDAASDEIIDNIKSWLALGDRNLVLVGNDPIWEDNGLYEDSNKVINKILEKLGSRMRIVPAKNIEYSIQGCVSQQDLNSNKYNITAANVPSYSAGVTIGTGNYYAKGVADIRIDLSRDGIKNYLEYMNCPEGATCGGGEPPVVNERCEFPLANSGDLRAEWTEQCVKNTPEGCKIITYKKNWPLNFSNLNPSTGCDNPPLPLFNKPYQEPVPVLTTAEHLPERPWSEPPTSGFFCKFRPVYEWRIIDEGSQVSYFAEDNINHISFDVKEDVDSNVVGIFNSFSYSGDFIDPEPVNGRDSLLQGVGRSFYPDHEGRTETRTVYPNSVLGLVESGKKDDGSTNNSRVYILGTQWSEDEASRGITAPTSNDDKNTEFYINMIKKDCFNPPRGLQINGFTGRTSLANAYYINSNVSTAGHRLGSKLVVELTPAGGSFIENAETSDINELTDFVWIANPSGKASAQELGQIKSWLDLGNKKLIITFNAASASSRQLVADNIADLCERLNLDSRPILLETKGQFATTNPIINSYNPNAITNSQMVNLDTDSIKGCENGYSFTSPNYNFDTSLEGLHFSLSSLSSPSDPVDPFGYDKRIFIPLSGGMNHEQIIWWDIPVEETYTVYPTNRWKIDGDSTIEFPATVGSGYRMFINWVSEGSVEKFNICGTIEGATTQLDGGITGGGGTGPDPDDFCGTEINLSKTTVFIPSQSVYDIKATGNYVRINLSTSPWSDFIPEDELVGDAIPLTPRVLSVSGCPLEIFTEIISERTSGEFLVGYEPYDCQWRLNNGRSGVLPAVSRPVSHLSNIYCNPAGLSSQCESLGSELIEDGPVVAAEEFENFSAFSSGRRRSKIILVTDSTILQGQCPYYLGPVTRGNQEFIRSLYPQTFSDAVGDLPPGFISDVISNPSGRNWFFSQKLRAPERGSAAKYHAISGAAIQNIVSPLYGGNGVAGNLSNYTDQEDLFDPTTLSRPEEIKDDEKIRQRLSAFYNSALSNYGMYPRFSGDFLDIMSDNPTPPQSYNEMLGIPGDDITFITDAQIGGGLNDLMKINGTDYLDIDVYYSGCLGDLFGYSIDLSNKKLVVGAPFNAFYTEGAASGVSGIVQWHEIQNDLTRSAAKIAGDGGAGAAFVYERTGRGKNVVSEFLPWEFSQKLKPSSLNVGMTDFSLGPITALNQQRGPHKLFEPNFIMENARKSDNFGAAVAIDCDMIAVGAPKHAFETLHAHLYSGVLTASGFNAAFQRKSFNGEYDIPGHEYYDLGSSGVRIDQFGGNSGTMVLNNGAVFTFRNEMVDFQRRRQQWISAEKLYAQGYKDRTQTWIGDDGLGGAVLIASGTENDAFGKSVSIDRTRRGDSDYTLVAGAPYHVWPTSGNHPTQNLEDAGAAYSFDAMLREQTPSIPNSGGWIDAHLFGQKRAFGEDDRLETRVYQNTYGSQQTYEVSGIVFTNSNGDIFLEVSGFDPSSKGFIAHRPYVDSVKFDLLFPTEQSGFLNMVTSGRPVLMSGDMHLTITGPDKANVYNSVDLYQFGTGGFSSGVMPLFTEAPSGQSDSLNLNLTSTQTTGFLDLRIRGF